MRPISLTVATYNLYLGADLAGLFTGFDPAMLARRVADTWAAVEASHPAERMASAAAVIARRVPDVLAVQEGVLWRVGEPGFTRRHDLLGSLVESLATLGAPYKVASLATGFSRGGVSAGLKQATGQWVELQDRCAILVRDDPAISLIGSRHDTFAARLQLPVLGTQIELARPWCAATVSIEDTPITVFATHLEAYDSRIRCAQMAQLLEQVEPTRSQEQSLILMGDLNCRPPQERSVREAMPAAAQEDVQDAYELALAAGLTDAWAAANPGQAGPTSGQDPALRNPESSLSDRIDFVLSDPQLRVRSAQVLGADPQDRTINGLWPSDHGCLMVELERD